MFMKLILKQRLTYIKERKENILIVNLFHRLMKCHIGWRYKYISDSSESDRKPRRRKYKPYEEISGEFKKIKPPMFNEEVEKGEEEEAWLSGMKKYFRI